MFFKKKSFQCICVDDIFKTVCGNFFKINGSRGILTLGDFTISEKLFFTIRLLIKRERQKYLENYAHGFGDNYLTNNFLKFLQDRI